MAATIPTTTLRSIKFGSTPSVVVSGVFGSCFASARSASSFALFPTTPVFLSKRSFFSTSPPSTDDTLRLNNISPTTVITPTQVSFDVPVYSFKKEALSTLSLPEHVFGSPLRTDILHRVLLWERAAMQQGTHKAKGRAEVAGSSRKMRPQKKQGTARMGNKRPPHFRGGGRAFPPIPRDHSFDLPRKVVKFGLRVGLSTKFAQNQMSVIDFSTLDSHKTKNLASLLKEHQWGTSILFVAGPQIDRPLELAAANLPTVDVVTMRQIRVYDLLRRQQLIIDPKAIHYYSRYLNTSKELVLPSYEELLEAAEREGVEGEEDVLVDQKQH